MMISPIEGVYKCVPGTTGGTVAIPPEARVLRIFAVSSTGLGTITLPDATVIAAATIGTNILPCGLRLAGNVVFAGTSVYFVEYVDPTP